jgi:hypothetical protein
MNTIFKKVAPSGLFGVEIISKDLKNWDCSPIQGTVTQLGIIDNIRIFEFTKDDKSNTYLSVDDVVFSGGVQLCKLGVRAQGFYSVNILSEEAEVGNYVNRGKELHKSKIINGKLLLDILPKAV